MNSPKKIISIIVILLIVLGLIGFSFFSKQKQSTNSDELNTQETSKQEDQSVTSSILDLIKSGAAQKCTFESNEGDTAMKGTTYVANNKIRSDMEITTAEGKMETFMISDGEWIYTWSKNMPQGMKMKMNTLEEKAKELETDISKDESLSFKDFQDAYEFKCEGWMVNPAMFTLPKDIQFMDLSATVENMMQKDNEGNINMCAACDFIQEADAKAECKANLGC